MRIAYIISAYKLPELLVRLVRRLATPHASFYIHVDARTPDDTFHRMWRPLSHSPNVHFLPRHVCYWGDFGHVAATLKGMRACLAADERPDYALLLTGQDYPLAANNEIEARLEKAAGQILIEHFPMPTANWDDGGMDRIEHAQLQVRGHTFRFPGQPFSNSFARRIWSDLTRALRLIRRFPPGLVPYGGSSYWCMPVECVEYVIGFVNENPRAMRFFRHTAVPDEMVFQTIVLNSHLREQVVQDDLRYIDWSSDGDGPEVLTMSDFDRIMTSGAMFARKFDPSTDESILDQIDLVIDKNQ